MSRKAFLKEFLDVVWSGGDAEAARRFVAERYVIRHDSGDPWEGQSLDRDGFVERVRLSRAAAPDQVFTVLDMIEDGDRIAVTWQWRGTHGAEIAGIPATGRRITMTGATVYTFDNGLISGHWQIADKLGVVMQLRGPSA